MTIPRDTWYGKHGSYMIYGKGKYGIYHVTMNFICSREPGIQHILTAYWVLPLVTMSKAREVYRATRVVVKRRTALSDEAEGDGERKFWIVPGQMTYRRANGCRVREYDIIQA